MKIVKLLFILVLLCLSATVHAQDPSAILDLESTTDGVLIPRMTETQRDAISNPVEGLMVYQTTAPKGFFYYDGSSWKQIGEGFGSSYWTQNGNDIYYESGKVGIGTNTPANDLDVDGQVRISSLSGQAGALVQATDEGVLEAFSVPTQTEVNVYPVFEGECQDSLDNPTDVFVLGNYAYVTSFDNHKLVIFDVSNPVNPVFMGETFTSLNAPSEVHVAGNHAYVASSGNNKLVIFNVSDPANPSWVGESSTNLFQPAYLSVSGDYAFVANMDNYAGFVVFDVSDPSNPTAISNNIPDSLNQIRGFCVSGTYAYCLEWWVEVYVPAPYHRTAIHTYDLSDPNNPVSVDELLMIGYFPYGVFVIDDLEYCVFFKEDSGVELIIFDVSNPASPSIVSTTSLTHDINDLFVSGDYCYLINSTGLEIYNVSNPTNCLRSGLSNISGESVFIKDDYGFVAGDVDKLIVFDAFAASLIPTYHRGSFSLEDNPWKPFGADVYTAGQVGIGTTDIDESLVVDGTVKMTSPKIESDAAVGKILTSDAEGYGSWQDPGSFLGLVPIGAIIAWAPNLTGVPGLPDQFMPCNGQIVSDGDSPMNGTTLPDLNGAQRFLRGSTSQGTTGGSDNHSHTGTAQASPAIVGAGPGASLVSHMAHTHDVAISTESSLPGYYTVNWIIRIK